jgi:LysM repeat protein
VGEQTYVVKSGDTPATIASRFRISTDELLAANGIDDPRRLQIGQTLRIPPPSR